MSNTECQPRIVMQNLQPVTTETVSAYHYQELSREYLLAIYMKTIVALLFYRL